MANTETVRSRKLTNKIENYKDQFETIGDSTLLEGLSDTLSAKYEDFKDSAEEAKDSTLSFVKKYPLYTLAGALAIGVVTAMFLSRSED
jgi:ElaB/YqjD/DUF883 family membrane-anchored ribosome-binding protein